MLFMSGYMDDAVDAHGLHEIRSISNRTPTLAVKVRDMLDRPRRSHTERV